MTSRRRDYIKIKAYKILNEKAVNEALNLEMICKKYDGLNSNVFLDTSLNFYPEMNSVFLLYEDGELLSILSMLVPTQWEAEISAFTYPEYRHNGYFTKLLSKAVQELKKFNIQEILFVCEKQSMVGQMVIATLNAQYAFTEYLMKFHKDGYSSSDTFRLLLIEPNMKDLEKIVDISMRTFAESFDDANFRIYDCLKSEFKEQYLAVLNNEIIGLCSINQEEDETSIFGLGILPEYRGQGYGKEFLCLILDRLIQRGKSRITLMVKGENLSALGLYKQFGFQIAATIEYYRKKL